MALDINRQDYVVLQKYVFSNALTMKYQGNIYECFNYVNDNEPRIVLPDRRTPSSEFFLALLKEGINFRKDTDISTNDLSPSFGCRPLDEKVKRLIMEDRMTVGMQDAASTSSAAQRQ